MKKTHFILAGAAIFVVLVMLFAALPEKMTDPRLAGDTAPARMTTSENPAANPADANPADAQTVQAAQAPVPSPVTTESQTPASPIASYATEADCMTSTGRSCHFIRCEGVGENQTAEDVCGPDFQEGWQAVVPTPDRTAIPEIIAPPMELRDAPAPATPSQE